MGQGEEGEQQSSGPPGQQACQQESLVKLSRCLVDSPKGLREIKKELKRMLDRELETNVERNFERMFERKLEKELERS